MKRYAFYLKLKFFENFIIKCIKKFNKAITGSGDQGNWMVQVGAFGNRNNALNLKEKMTKSGYIVSISKLASSKRTLFAVRVGPFEHRQTAKNKGQELNKHFRLNYQLLKLEK